MKGSYDQGSSPPSGRLRLRRIILRSLLVLSVGVLGLELTYRERLPQIMAGVAIVSSVNDERRAPPEAGQPPFSPPTTAQRIALMNRLRSLPGFYQRVSGPTTIVAYQRHDLPALLQALSTEVEEVPGAFSLKVAALTSYFKHAGISGWDDAGHVVVVEGAIDQNAPTLGDDQMLTIDLRISRMFVDGEDVSAQLEGQRFIRVEVFGAVLAQLSERPQLGQCLRVEGPLRVDNDREGFYEVHPRAGSAVQLVDCQAQGAWPLRGRL